jgi:hypothetical protein
MKLAIMQPYFFPYIGYFQLINNVDRFILFDDVQYIRHGWVNRNRILKPGEGWQYIIAPLQKHKQAELIKDTKLQEGDEWKKKFLRQLDHYKKKAKYFDEVMQLLTSCFDSNEINIAKFNAHCLAIFCKHMEIPFNIEISSEMNFDYSNVKDAGEWALRISEQLNAKEYINPAGGKELFDRNKFINANIKLVFLSPSLEPYDQKRNNFETGLSIIDVLMFNGRAKTKENITKFKMINS